MSLSRGFPSRASWILPPLLLTLWSFINVCISADAPATCQSNTDMFTATYWNHLDLHVAVIILSPWDLSPDYMYVTYCMLNLRPTGWMQPDKLFYLDQQMLQSELVFTGEVKCSDQILCVYQIHVEEFTLTNFYFLFLFQSSPIMCIIFWTTT